MRTGWWKRCKEFQPDFVGISLRNIDDVLIRQREKFYDELAPFTATIRQHSQAPVVLGGSGFSIFPEKLLALTGADYGIAGEGEPGILALAGHAEKWRRFQPRSRPRASVRRENCHQSLRARPAGFATDARPTVRRKSPGLTWLPATR